MPVDKRNFGDRGTFRCPLDNSAVANAVCAVRLMWFTPRRVVATPVLASFVVDADQPSCPCFLRLVSQRFFSAAVTDCRIDLPVRHPLLSTNGESAKKQSQQEDAGRTVCSTPDRVGRPRCTARIPPMRFCVLRRALGRHFCMRYASRQMVSYRRLPVWLICRRR